MGRGIPQVGDKRVFEGKQYEVYSTKVFFFNAVADKRELERAGWIVRVVEGRKGAGWYVIYRRRRL